MALMDKLTKATQDAVRGARDFTDTARLNSLITDEEKQIVNLYSQIGKIYYETCTYNPETPIGQMCVAINEANKRIAKHKEDIRQIKGTKRCPKCNAEIPLSSMFCGECGAKIEITSESSLVAETPKKVCANCGAELAENLAFCTSCGSKQ